MTAPTRAATNERSLETPQRGANRGGRKLDACLAAAAFWYFSGLVFSLALSAGFALLRPGPVARLPRGDVIDALAIHDGRWYKQIAEQGYSYDPNRRSNVAFFPLHPVRPLIFALLASSRLLS